MFEILYEDNHIIVAEKPQNTIIAGDITGDKSMLDSLKEYVKEKYNNNVLCLFFAIGNGKFIGCTPLPTISTKSVDSSMKRISQQSLMYFIS